MRAMRHFDAYELRCPNCWTRLVNPLGRPADELACTEYVSRAEMRGCFPWTLVHLPSGFAVRARSRRTWNSEPPCRG